MSLVYYIINKKKILYVAQGKIIQMTKIYK